MNAILVCVDFSDLLAITLPYNRHHFDQVMLVTTPTDEATLKVAYANRALTFKTTAFTEDGALFNKWKALEQGLDNLGREGWLCIMDADILWPKNCNWWNKDGGFPLQQGCLYTPRRRMLPMADLAGGYGGVPPNNSWECWPLHPQQQEFAGYTQIFHASDPVLGKPPWHEVNWTHAGGADSLFQAKWPQERKVRPPFEVLHLGESGVNWCGRATAYVDGTVPEGADKKKALVRSFIRGRRPGPVRFDGEKIKPS